jgi:hypothetical protein
MYAIVIMVGIFIIGVTNNSRKHTLLAAGRRCRTTTMTLMFRKLLRLNKGKGI